MVFQMFLCGMILAQTNHSELVVTVLRGDSCYGNILGKTDTFCTFQHF